MNSVFHIGEPPLFLYHCLYSNMLISCVHNKMRSKTILNIKIATAEPEDAEEILKVQYAAFQSEAMLHNDFTIQPLTQTLDELLAEFQTRLILKAVLNGRIVGSVRAYADGDTVYIGKLIVHPDHQGKGLGKRLLSTVESKLHRKRFELYTSAKSERNLHIYEKSGYTRFREETDEAGIRFVYLEKRYDDGMGVAMGISFGMIAGTIIGVLTGNIGIWMPVGMCLGLAVGAALGQKLKKLARRG